VYKVFSKTFADSTNAAIVAVVYPLVRVILPKFTFVAIVPRGILATLDALLSSRLWCTTKHTEHVFSPLAIEGMWIWKVFRRVVTMSARKPALAIVALDLDVPFVVNTSQIRNLLVADGLVGVVKDLVCPDRERAEAGRCISGEEFIRVA
jgi:hypothetical protein